MDQTMRPMQGTQMIDRTVLLLRLVATFCPRGARLTDLAQESGLPSPTVRRILKRLTQHGLIAQDAQGQRYALGPLSQELALGSSPTRRLAERHAPLLHRFVAETGAVGYLLMRSGLDSLCIAKLKPDLPGCAETQIQVGDRLPLGVGVGGMTLLSTLPEAEAEEVIRANAAVYGRFVRTTGANFRDHLEAARRDGVVLRRSPVTAGVLGFAMPLPGASGLAIAGAVAAKAVDAAARETLVAQMRAVVAQAAQAPETSA